MAKLNYSKPLFVIQQIPLNQVAHQCSINSTSGDYICPVVDPEMGEVLFQSESDGCLRVSLDGGGMICYMVSIEGGTVFNS